MAELDKIKDHLHEAYKTIEERNLYGIWDYIPKSGDLDFKGDSFNEAVRQGIGFKSYDAWADTLEDLFLAHKLDYLKFKRVTVSGDSRKTSQEPAALFMRRVKELERIFEDPDLLASYGTKEKKPATWPRVEFSEGVVKQGARSHTFTVDRYGRLISALWPNRRIVSPTGAVLVEGKSISRDELNKIADIKGHRRFVDIATGIKKAMRSKGIGLNIMYPADAILIVKQDRQ